MEAYILIRVAEKGSRDVQKFLRTSCREHVLDAEVLIGGERDVIAKVTFNNVRELDEILFTQIQGHPRVDSTVTYIVSESS